MKVFNPPFARPLTEAEVARLCGDGTRAATDALAADIGLAPDLVGLVHEAGRDLDLTSLLPQLEGIFIPERWQESVDRLTLRTRRDQSGMTLLAIYLRCLNVTRRRYADFGLPDRTFRDTMGFFPRMLEAYRSAHGRVWFDEANWAVRQVSLTLLRIDGLEFEFIGGDSPRVDLHIPSDASLEAADLARTFAAFRTFLKDHCPAWTEAAVHCESWLLDPGLDELLPQRSRIRVFRGLFHVEGLQWADDFREWTAGRTDLADADLPERTSLQRAIKRHLLAGGRMGVGKGVLIPQAVSALDGRGDLARPAQ